METRLTVTRNSSQDIQHRQVILKLDGRDFATLLFGQTVSTLVEPGRHRLRANNTFIFKTVDFQIEQGMHKTFEIVNRPGRFTWWMIALLGAGPIYLTFRENN